MSILPKTVLNSDWNGEPNSEGIILIKRDLAKAAWGTWIPHEETVAEETVAWQSLISVTCNSVHVL